MITQEKAFENLARILPRNQQEYLSRVTNYYYPMPIHERHRAWLQLLGLIETWVIIHDR